MSQKNIVNEKIIDKNKNEKINFAGSVGSIGKMLW